MSRFVLRRASRPVLDGPMVNATATADRPLLTVDEAAAVLRIARSSFYNLLRAKKIPVTRVEGRRLIHRDDLDAYIRSVRVP